MRIVLVGGQGYPEHLIAAALKERGDLALHVAERATLGGVLRHILRRRGGVIKRLDRAAYYVLYHTVLGRVLKRGRGRYQRAVAAAAPDMVAGDINAPEVLGRVAAAAPDLILVSRTGILRRGWFELGVPMINVHPGIAPRYRGLASAMWAVIEGDAGNIGVTVHRIAPQVDTGEIIVQARIDDPGDLGIEEMRAKIAHLMEACALRAIDLQARGLRQEGVPENHGRYPAYLELGLTDFVRFLWKRRRWREGGS